MTEGGLRSATHSHLPCTKMLTDRKSWRVPGGLIRWNAHRTMSHCYFFPTLVQLQRSGERHLVRFWRRWQRLVSSPLTHLSGGILNYGTRVSRESFWFPQKAEDFVRLPVSAEERMPQLCGGMKGEQRPLFLQPGGRGLMAGWDMVLAAQWGGWQDGHGRLLNLFFAFSSLLSSTGILSLYIRYTRSLCCKTGHSFFFFGGD